MDIGANHSSGGGGHVSYSGGILGGGGSAQGSGGGVGNYPLSCSSTHTSTTLDGFNSSRPPASTTSTGAGLCNSDLSVGLSASQRFDTTSPTMPSSSMAFQRTDRTSSRGFSNLSRAAGLSMTAGSLTHGLGRALGDTTPTPTFIGTAQIYLSAAPLRQAVSMTNLATDNSLLVSHFHNDFMNICALYFNWVSFLSDCF